MHRVGLFSLILFIFCAGFLQVTAFDYISFAGIKPDILLILVVLVSVSCREQDSLRASVAAGLIKDVFSSAIFGSYIISFFIIGLFLNYHKSKFYRERPSTQFLLTYLSYIVMAIIVFWLNSLAHKQPGLFYVYMNIALKGGLYTAAASPVVFFLASRILRIKLMHAIRP